MEIGDGEIEEYLNCGETSKVLPLVQIMKQQRKSIVFFVSGLRNIVKTAPPPVMPRTARRPYEQSRIGPREE